MKRREKREESRRRWTEGRRNSVHPSPSSPPSPQQKKKTCALPFFFFSFLVQSFRQRHLRPIGSVTNEGRKKQPMGGVWMQELAARFKLRPISIFSFDSGNFSLLFLFALRPFLFFYFSFCASFSLSLLARKKTRREGRGGEAERERGNGGGQHFQFQLSSWRVMAAESSFSRSRFASSFRWFLFCFLFWNPRTKHKRLKIEKLFVCFVFNFVLFFLFCFENDIVCKLKMKKVMG